MPKELIYSPNGGLGGGFGTVAEALLACNMDTQVLRTNGTLRQDEWKEMDKAILMANRSRMLGVADLKSRGLVFNLPNALATMQFEYEKASKLGRAQISMDGEAQGQRDRLTFSMGYLPIPITFQDYSMNARVLAASRLRGSKLDTATGAEAGISVAEETEIMLFQGCSSFKYGDGTIYGYTDHPDRLLGDFTAWDESGGDPVGTIRAMKQALVAIGFYGPYVAYVPTTYGQVLDDDYVAGYPKTVRQRILEIERVEAIKVADFLPDTHVLLVQMTENVVRMVEGLALQNVEWKEGAGMRTNFKVLQISVPQIRSDKDGNCGVAHYTET